MMASRTCLLAIGLGIILALAAVVGRALAAYQDELSVNWEQQSSTLTPPAPFVGGK